ncbi:MAG TPA: sialidase family protein [Acidimicrobiales bacterium]|nr:sialidase family protein [Acidimicrobiales bacterium]
MDGMVVRRSRHAARRPGRAGTGAGALLLAGLCAGFLPAAAASTTAPMLTKPVQATKADTDPARTYTSPSIAVDPEDSNVFVMGYVEARSRRCGLMRSMNAGQTWTKLDASPATPSFPDCFVISGNVDMAPIAFGRHHALYYALSGYDDGDGGQNNGNISVLLARSTDLGNTWTTTVVRNARGKTGADAETSRPVSDLAVDTSGPTDIVYVAWRADYRQTSSPNATPREADVAVSTDEGKTFGPPVNVGAPAWAQPSIRQAALATITTVPGAAPPAAGSKAATPDQPGNFGSSNPSLAVDGKGKVYVSWPAAYTNISPTPLPAIWLSTSTDHGKTYSASPVTPFQAGLSTFGTQRLRWSPKGGPDGSLHLVYEGTTQPTVSGATDAFYEGSTDGGKTWSKPRALNDDDPKAIYPQNSPNLSIAPNGRIDVVWFDARNDPGIRAQDVYMTSSTDNGATWAKNTRVTDQLINRKIGIWANGYDVAVPPGVASTDKLTVVGWDDTRNFNELTQGQDLYTSEAQFATLGGGPSKAAKVALAAVGAVAILGLILLAVSLATRTRPTPPAKTPAQPVRV